MHPNRLDELRTRLIALREELLKEIAPKRLAFDPTALLCIDCAERSENLSMKRS